MFEHLAQQPGHNANMLFADYATAGIGFATGNHGVIGTQHFGIAPNGGTDTGVVLLRRDGCPGARPQRARPWRRSQGASACARPTPEQERKRAKRKLRKAKRALAEARRPRSQCHLTTYAGSSLSPPG